MNRFIVGVVAGDDVQKTADKVVRLIPNSKVDAFNILSILILDCDCRTAEEVKEKLASCRSITRVVSDFPTQPPDDIIEADPSSAEG